MLQKWPKGDTDTQNEQIAVGKTVNTMLHTELPQTLNSEKMQYLWTER